MFYSIQKRDDVLGFNRNGQPEPKLNLPDWTVGADANRLSEIDLEMMQQNVIFSEIVQPWAETWSDRNDDQS